MAHRGRRLTDDEKREIVRRYLTGEQVKAIAKSFNVAMGTISRTAREASAVFEGKRHWSRAKTYDPEPPAPTLQPPIASIYTPSLAEVARLKAKGLKNTAIAALLRMPYRVIEGVPAATQA